MEEKEVFYNMLRGKVGYSFTYGDLSEITKGINVLIALKDDLQQQNKELQDRIDKVIKYLKVETDLLKENEYEDEALWAYYNFEKIVSILDKKGE